MGVKYTDEQKELIAAARTGDCDALRRIIASGFPIDCELKYGSSALTIAASRGQHEAVQLLVEAGAKVNRRNQFGSSPLQEACDRGHQDVIKLLIELGADVNMPHNNGSTVLLLSAMKRDIKTVRLLLAMGADPDLQNFEGWSARRWVKSEANRALLDVFGISRDDLPTAAVKEAEVTQIVEVDDLRVIPSAADGAFWAVFMRAASMGDVATLRRLVEDDGVEVNGQSPNGTTALMAAMKNGHVEAACKLIELGADLDIRDHEGLSAVAWATKKGQRELLKQLQDRGLARSTEQGDLQQAESA